MTRYQRAMVWFRRDLRCEDHAALSQALREAREVHCVFVFDSEILDALPRKSDRRVEFIWHSLAELKSSLESLGGGLHVLHGNARELIPAFAREHNIEAVYANRDYEPFAVARDHDIAESLAAEQRELHTFKDQVIFDESEILTGDERPYVVFTPYKRAWLAKLKARHVEAFPVAEHAAALVAVKAAPIPALEDIGFSASDLLQLGIPAGMSGARNLFEDFLERISHYAKRRDFPALAGPSYLSVHLRFGTISIRELVRSVINRKGPKGEGAQTWLSELIWREFYFSILHHFPHVTKGAFRRQYDALRFDNSEDDFQAWCKGMTGYPIVDAAMRQINSTGYMHNRLRMISASFLVKDLHIDWRWGERYFADHLNDFDLAANNGGWQWCASTGCDAQPYFRIFNPVTQSKKFDADGDFIRSLVPELAGVPKKYIHEPWTMPPEEQSSAACRIGHDYPAPIVDHALARKKTLAMFAKVRDGGS